MACKRGRSGISLMLPMINHSKFSKTKVSDFWWLLERFHDKLQFKLFSQLPLPFQIGKFFGEIDSSLMRRLLNTSLYAFNKSYDFQSVCDPESETKAAAGLRSVYVVSDALHINSDVAYVLKQLHAEKMENWNRLHFTLLFFFPNLSWGSFNWNFYCTLETWYSLLIL